MNEKSDKEDLVQLSLTEGALFHMMLLTSAMHLNYIRADKNMLEYDYHKLSAIELVNTRLQALNDGTQIPDATMLAVAYLAISDVRSPLLHLKTHWASNFDMS